MSAENTFFLALIFFFFFFLPAIDYAAEKMRNALALKSKRLKMRFYFILGIVMLVAYHDPMLIKNILVNLFDVLRYLFTENTEINDAAAGGLEEATYKSKY